MMTYTPFEREMLKRQDRTIELLEYLVMAHRPMKVVTGVAYTGPADAQSVDQLTPLPEGLQVGQVGGGVTEQALAAAGIVPMVRRPGSGQPETPEQRAERFAARAKEVGLPEEKAAEVSGRVQLNLDTLTEAPLEQLPPPAKAPRKKAGPPAQ